MIRATLLLGLLIAPLVALEPPGQPAPPAAGAIVSLPKSLSGSAGDLITVKAESGAELITWDASTGLTLTHPKPFDAAQKSIAIHAAENGVYALVASIPSGKETRVAICIVTVGPRPPPPPPPVPTFQSKLQDAFKADGSPIAGATKLAALYRQASASTVQDAGLATGAALLAEMQQAVKLLGIPHGSMDKTARVIADELNVSFKNVTALDQSTRAAIAAAFIKIAAALEGLK